MGKNKSSQKTEILFIERCIDFLKPETGKMGIVLPDGILTNSSLQYVRDFIMERCEILAVISLPQFAFSHYGAGVKSSLLFLRRKGTDEILEQIVNKPYTLEADDFENVQLINHLLYIGVLQSRDEKLGLAMPFFTKNDVEVLKNLGLCQINLGEFDSAKNTFEKVVKLKDNDATSWFYLANSAEKTTDIALA